MPSTGPESTDFLHVAVGVIISGSREILIARRPGHLHQGGLWEFPGGKVEADEHVCDALCRELTEELGLSAEPAGMTPLTEVRHAYSDRAVCLDVWWVREFTGTAEGLEGQEVRWVPGGELADYRFPAANVPILEAVVRELGVAEESR